MESTIKAYGKILVFGSYSILEPGNTGLVVNVDKGTTTTVQQTHTGRIVIDLSTFEIKVYGIRESHKLKLNETPEKLKFIKNAVEYTFRYLNHKGIEIKDIRLISVNDPEVYLRRNIKTGFGSSATSTVSAVAAILNLHDINDRDLVYKISQYSHFKSQGNMGSGFDISAACYGSHFFITPSVDMNQDFISCIESDWNIQIQEFDINQVFIPVVVFTGKSAFTQKLVRKVLDFKKQQPAKYKNFLNEYNKINIALKKAFDGNWHKRIKFFLEKSWEMRKQLGKMAKASIEPDKFTKLNNEMKDNGAFTAGLTGAGGGDSILALCKNEEDKIELMEFLKKKRLTVLNDVNIVNKKYELLN
jgi:ERG8-type phosphomevalonate kinase